MVKSQMEQYRTRGHGPAEVLRCYPGPHTELQTAYTKMKVATRHNLLREWENSKWGTSASTLRTIALALCNSIPEYAAPVWARSKHAHVLDSELNTACRAITSCLKPTNVEDLYLLAEIEPSDIRGDVCARV